MMFVNSIVQWIARRFGYVVVLEKIATLPNSAMMGSKIDFKYLDHVAELMEEFTSVKPRNLFEVGANFAQDSYYLAEQWGIADEKVYVFEPHPDICRQLSSQYSFNVVPKAVSNVDSSMDFWAVDLETTTNSGISSLRDHSVNESSSLEPVRVEVVRLDTFCGQSEIDSIDFLKIDVEGLSFEVLDGLGEFINNVSVIQMETEFIPVWVNQKVQDEIYGYLQDKGFQLIEHVTQSDGVQADSLWIRQDLVRHRIFDMINQQWVVR